MNELNALGSGSTSSYRAQAVTFDGLNDYLSRGTNLTGLTNSKTFTFSGWFKFSSTGDSQTLICSKGSSDTFLQISRLGSGGDTGKLRITGVGTGSVTRLDVTTEDTVSLDVWHYIAASFDLSDTNKRHVTIDTNETSLTVATYTNAVINFTSVTEFLIGSAEAGTPQLFADVADFWFNTGYIDITDSTVIRKFVNGTRPAYLGSDGSRVTGSQPLLYLSVFGSAAASTFATNKGSGGGFTITGSLTAASTSPAI